MHFLRIIALGALLAPQSLFGMEKEDKIPFSSPRKTYTITKSKKIRETLYQALKNACTYEKIKVHADTFVLSDPAIYNMLVKIAQKKHGAVSLHVSPSHWANKKIIALAKEHFTLIQEKQHGKRIIIRYKNDNEKRYHTRTFEGSYNPTLSAFQKNSEINLITHNNMAYYKQHRQSHYQGKTGEYNGTQVEKITPRKRKVVDTTTHNLNATLAQRIKPDQGGTLYLGTMGYSDKTVHEKLLAFCNTGTVHLLIDASAVNKKCKPLLNALHKAGAHIVVGKVDKENAKKQGIFHKKYLVRLTQDQEVNLVVIGSANLTDAVQNDFNHASYHPNQPELGKKIIVSHTADAKNGIAYKQYLKTLKKKKKKKK